MIRLLLVAVFLGGCTADSTAPSLEGFNHPAFAAATVWKDEVQYPSLWATYNPCNNDQVELQGIQTIRMMSVSIPQTGQFQWKLHYEFHGVGFGSYGDSYVGGGTLNITFTGGGADVHTQVAPNRWISQGSGGNFVINQIYHITTLPSGQVAVEFSKFGGAECQGQS